LSLSRPSKTELRDNNYFIPQLEFLTAKDSIYNPGWLPGRIASYVIGKPLWWSLEQLGIVGDEGLLGSSSSGSHKDTRWWGDYVVVSLLERAADEVLQMQQEKVGGASDKLYTFEGFRRAFRSVLATETMLSEGDTKNLLKFLERDRKAIVFNGKVCSAIHSIFSRLLLLQAGDQIYFGRDIYCT
jgi:charged multivesicular body protein 7